MNKYRLLIPALGASLLFAGCSRDSSLKKASVTFFEAFNHLCEADTLSLQGQIALLGIDADFSLLLDSPEQQAALTGSTNQGHIAFYLRDGRTYLDYLGTKSASLASNVGIKSDTPLRLPNPFLELDQTARNKVFDSVKMDGDSYAFVMNRSIVSSFLDSYGAVDVDSATLDTVIHDGQIESLQLDVSGTYDIGSAKAPLDLTLDVDDILIDQTVTIDFPADLDSWSSGDAQ